MYDKNKLLERLGTRREIKLEFGSGPARRHSDAIAIDAIDYPDVDIVGDALDVLSRFPDGSIAEVHSYHFLEHVNEPEEFLRLSLQKLADGGRLQTTVPHFANPFYSSDPTHKNRFGLYTMSYYFKDEILRRTVPRYAAIEGGELSEVRIVFKSLRPRYIRHGLKKALERLVNATYWTMEAYEELFCWILPPYEIRYQIVKRSGATRASTPPFADHSESSTGTAEKGNSMTVDSVSVAHERPRRGSLT